MNILLPKNWKEVSENYFENEVSGFVVREFDNVFDTENTYFQILDANGVDCIGQCFTIFENPFDIADNEII
jgi:hypothetical protein